MTGAQMEPDFSAHRQILVLFILSLVVIAMSLMLVLVFGVQIARNNVVSGSEAFTLRASMAHRELNGYTTMARWLIGHAESEALDDPDDRVGRALRILNALSNAPRWTGWSIVDFQDWTIYRSQELMSVPMDIPAAPDVQERIARAGRSGIIALIRLDDGTVEPVVMWTIDLGDAVHRAAMLRLSLAEVIRPMAEPLETELVIEIVDEDRSVLYRISQGDSTTPGVSTGNPRATRFRFHDAETADFEPSAMSLVNGDFTRSEPTVRIDFDIVHTFIPIPSIDGGFVLVDHLTLLDRRIRRIYVVLTAVAVALYASLVGFFLVVHRNLRIQNTRTMRAIASRDSLLLLFSHKLQNHLTVISAEARRLTGIGESDPAPLNRTIRVLSRTVTDILYYSQFHDRDGPMPDLPSDAVMCIDILDFLEMRVSEDADDARVELHVVQPDDPSCEVHVNLATILDLLERILVFMISSAPEESRITVRVVPFSGGRTLRITVPERSLVRFRRLSEASSEKLDGDSIDGIDLYVMYRLLNLVHASLRLEPRAAEQSGAILVDLFEQEENIRDR